MSMSLEAADGSRAAPDSVAPGPILRDTLDADGRMARARTGLGLAALVIGAWLAAHVYAVWFFTAEGVGGALFGVALFVGLTWLSVGLFIIAHDAMHGSLAPGRVRLNRRIGAFCLFIYAGFSFDRMLAKHRLHHRHPGAAADPDFDQHHPYRPWPWFKTFMVEYLGLREILVLAAISWGHAFLLGDRWPMILLFWAAPAVLASFQLFYFGTYLPHRHADDAFADGHRSRSNDYSVLWSLLTCFHFGYHHEHHLAPSEPWWRLPMVRRGRKDGTIAISGAGRGTEATP